MPTIKCAHDDSARTFEHDDAAFAAGWLRMKAGSRAFWLCPEHLDQTASVLIREGILTLEVTREGRVRE